MLTLKFKGWFQCRLATNPDPADEPRGVSGFTYALPGEDDLDRLIRFQPPGTVWRCCCPPIGVYVTDVYENGAKINNHVLSGAEVKLLHEPKFVGENGIVVEYSEPIVPFHLCINKGDLRLSRPHAEESFPFEGDLRGKQPNYCPGEIAEATGVWDAEGQWRARMDELERKLNETSDEVEKAALEMRIEMFRKAVTEMTFAFWAKVPYFIPLDGKAEVKDPKQQLRVDTKAPWAVDFWMGAWDTDALSGFVCGFVTIPFSPAGSRTNEDVHAQRDVSRTIGQPGHV